MWKKHIFLKILKWQLFISVVIFSLLFYLSSSLIKRKIYANTEKEILFKADILKEKILPLIEKKQFKKIQSVIVENAVKSNMKIKLLDENGIIMIDSEYKSNILNKHKKSGKIILESGNGILAREYKDKITGKKIIDFSIPLQIKNELKYILEIEYYPEYLNGIFKNLKNIYFFVLLFYVFISFIVLLPLTRKISIPFDELKHALKSISEGNFNIRLYSESNYTKELTDSFNDAIEKIKYLFTELSHQQEELKNIIESVKESIVLIDKNDVIKQYNSNFKNLIRVNDIEGKFYWEFIRNPELIHNINELKNKDRGSIFEIIINDRNYLVATSKMKINDQIIITFNDITEIKEIQTMKKDIVASVSHELKTPLTSIKGFIETIGENIKDKKNLHFLELTKKNIDRLINIINDLLTLSKLESKKIEKELESIKIDTVIDYVVKIFEYKIKQKGLNLIIEIEKNLPEFKADLYNIEQLLINLLDNAINYTEKGNIKIKAKKQEDYLILEVSDTGIGIPEKDLPRIFERFYVVDKSRSRRSGGTGLGLSIVKHIVNLYNGEIDVQSFLGKGSTFTVKLPIKS